MNMIRNCCCKSLCRKKFSPPGKYRCWGLSASGETVFEDTSSALQITIPDGITEAVTPAGQYNAGLCFSIKSKTIPITNPGVSLTADDWPELELDWEEEVGPPGCSRTLTQDQSVVTSASTDLGGSAPPDAITFSCGPKGVSGVALFDTVEIHDVPTGSSGTGPTAKVALFYNSVIGKGAATNPPLDSHLWAVQGRIDNHASTTPVSTIQVFGDDSGSVDIQSTLSKRTTLSFSDGGVEARASIRSHQTAFNVPGFWGDVILESYSGLTTGYLASSLNPSTGITNSGYSGVGPATSPIARWSKNGPFGSSDYIYHDVCMNTLGITLDLTSPVCFAILKYENLVELFEAESEPLPQYRKLGGVGYSEAGGTQDHLSDYNVFAQYGDSSFISYNTNINFWASWNYKIKKTTEYEIGNNTTHTPPPEIVYSGSPDPTSQWKKADDFNFEIASADLQTLDVAASGFDCPEDDS